MTASTVHLTTTSTADIGQWRLTVTAAGMLSLACDGARDSVRVPLREGDQLWLGGSTWRCISVLTAPAELDDDPFAPARVSVGAVLERVEYMHA